MRRLPSSSKTISNKPSRIYGITVEKIGNKKIWHFEHFQRVEGSIREGEKISRAVRYNGSWNYLNSKDDFVRLIKTAQTNKKIEIYIEGNRFHLYGRTQKICEDKITFGYDPMFGHTEIEILSYFDVSKSAFVYETFGI